MGYNPINQTIQAMYLGASDTLTNTLCWMVLHLANDHNIQTRCFDEIEKSIERHGTVQRDDCNFLESFLLENMRMFPVGDTLPHRNDKDIILDGHLIKKGCMIQGSLSSIMHNPKNFENPNLFKPDRFLVDGKFVHDVRVCPFSVGLRNCIGKQLASEEYFYFAAQIIRNFIIKADKIDFTPARTYAILKRKLAL